MKFVGDCGAETVVFVLAELFAGTGSTADELLTLAVLEIVSPFRSVLITEPTRVTVPDCPLAKDANVIVRFNPAPLSQTPPGPAVQDTKVKSARGRRSFTATDAALGPLLVIVMLYVIWPPAVTGSGVAICVMEKSVWAQLLGG